MHPYNHNGKALGTNPGPANAREPSTPNPPARIHPRTGQFIQATVRTFDSAGISFTLATYETHNGETIGESMLTWTDRDKTTRSLACASTQHAINVAKVISGER